MYRAITIQSKDVVDLLIRGGDLQVRYYKIEN